MLTIAISLLIIESFIGILGGMLGVGGGILLIPILHVILSTNMQTSEAINLLLLVLPTRLFAAHNYYKERLIDFTFIKKAFPFIIIGIIIGSFIASTLTSNYLSLLFITYLVYTIFSMYRDKYRLSHNYNLSHKDIQNNKNKEIEKETILTTKRKNKATIMVGILGGIGSGIFGIGGAIIYTPFMLKWLKMDFKKVIGTIVCIQVIPFSIVGVITYYLKGYIHFSKENIIYILFLFIGNLIGVTIGSKVAIYLKSKLLKTIFLYVLIFSLFLELYNLSGNWILHGIRNLNIKY